MDWVDFVNTLGIPAIGLFAIAMICVSFVARGGLGALPKMRILIHATVILSVVALAVLFAAPHSENVLGAVQVFVVTGLIIYLVLYIH